MRSVAFCGAVWYNTDNLIKEAKAMPDTEYPTIEELKAVKTPHGGLVGCSYSASSNGMMYNSNTLYYISLDKTDEGQVITVRKKESLCSETQSVYKTTEDVLAKISVLAERENMSAWGGLKYRQEYIVYDYSSSCGLTLYYDDTALGGYKKTPVNINADAVFQQGGGDVVKEFVAILEEGVNSAEFISENAPEPNTPNVFGNLSIFRPEPDEKPPAAGSWRCPCCGCDTNTGRFCCECGSIRPQD